VLTQTFIRLQIPIDDLPSEDILTHLPACIAFIERQLRIGRGVLVHCGAGMSRSASVVVAYMMQKEKSGLQEVIGKVRELRAIVE